MTNLNGLGTSPQAVAQAQVQEKLQNRFEELMLQEVFPEEHIPMGWHDWKKQAMKHVAPLSQGLSGEDFMFIYSSQPGMPMNLYWFGVANNIIQTTTFRQMQDRYPNESGALFVRDGDETREMNDMDTYCKIMDVCTRIAKIWTGMTKDLRTQVKEEFEYEQEQLLKKVGGSKNTLRAQA